MPTLRKPRKRTTYSRHLLPTPWQLALLCHFDGSLFARGGLMCLLPLKPHSLLQRTPLMHSVPGATSGLFPHCSLFGDAGRQRCSLHLRRDYLPRG